MADNNRVSQTSIQRNILDVATELTQLSFRDKTINSVLEVEEAFVRFHTLLRVLREKDYSAFKEFLPTDVKKIIE